MNDIINSPSHYKDVSGIECIEITRHMGFCGGNCFKYLYRAGKKGDMLEDLKKARKYAEWANEDDEKVPASVAYDLSKVKDSRSGYIPQAMSFLSASIWETVIFAIDMQIQREEAKQ